MYNPLFTLYIYSHYVKVVNPTPRIINLLLFFNRKYEQKQWNKERNKWVVKSVKTYAYHSPCVSQFRYHINQLPPLLELLESNYVTKDLYTVKKVDLYEPEPISVSLRPKWQLYDYQIPIVDYLSRPYDANSSDRKIACRSRLVGIATGMGKSIMSLAASARIGYRTMIRIKPAFIEKWCSDIVQYLDIDKNDIMVVQGGDHLKGLIHLAKENKLDSKYIILSTRTYQNYIKMYEMDPSYHGDSGYGCLPEDLFSTLKVGTVIDDEVHLEFHAYVKGCLYTHLPLNIALSATLINQNPFLEDMYNMAFPKETRYDDLELDRYIKVYALSYFFKDVRPIRTTEYGSNNYSHAAFEKSIIRRKNILDSYLELIRFTLETGYIREYMPNDKVRIYASTIDMCSIIYEYLKSRYPQYTVGRYVEDDEYQAIIEPDITVTTIGSGGTAIDIPNLRTVILTVNISSHISNVQTMGRLRKLKDRDTKFYFLYCSQIPKHKEYYQQKIKLLRNRVDTIKDFHYPYHVG